MFAKLLKEQKETILTTGVKPKLVPVERPKLFDEAEVFREGYSSNYS